MKNLKIIALLVLLGNATFSQKIKQNQANWFSYVGQYTISPKLGFHLEASLRLDDALKMSNQNLFRIGGYLNLNKKTTITAGYGLINTLNTGLKDYFNEDRIWQQLQHNHRWNENKNFFTNRFRLEQRFVDVIGNVNGSIDRVETNYQNRFRYLNRNLFHIANLKSSSEQVYMVLQNEVFVNIGTNKVNPKFFDQNRFLVGMGFNYKNSSRFEVAYLNQLLNSKSGSDVMNHTFTVTLLQNLILYKD